MKNHRCRTGMVCPETGFYLWTQNTDGTRFPEPTPAERLRWLIKGNRVPPQRSCNRGGELVQVILN